MQGKQEHNGQGAGGQSTQEQQTQAAQCWLELAPGLGLVWAAASLQFSCLFSDRWVSGGAHFHAAIPTHVLVALPRDGMPTTVSSDDVLVISFLHDDLQRRHVVCRLARKPEHGFVSHHELWWWSCSAAARGYMARARARTS